MAKTKLASTAYADVIRPGVKALVLKAGGNVFHYAAAIEATFERHFADLSGYKRITTFASDLAIAECYGDNAILDTFDRVCDEWLSDYKFFTEFVLTLNWLCWFWHDFEETELSLLYANLYHEASDKFFDHYRAKKDDSAEVKSRKNDAMTYYLNTTD